MANEVKIKLNLDDKDVKEGYDRAKKGARSAASRIKKAFSFDPFRRIFRSVFNLRNSLVGLGAAFAGVFTLNKIIESAKTQETAINALNQSLINAGTFSKAASESFQTFASDLQRISTVGDETTLQLAALARNFTATNDQAMRLTQAAVELSASTGISLDGAVKNLGKSMGGLVGELGESIPALRDLTAEQLKAGQAIDFVLERFGGSAQARLRTFAGVTEQLGNTWGDLLETFGQFITQNPLVVKILQSFDGLFSDLNKELMQNREGITSFTNDVILGLADAAINVALAFDDIVIAFRNVDRVLNALGAIFLGLRKKLEEFNLAVYNALSIFGDWDDQILSTKGMISALDDDIAGLVEKNDGLALANERTRESFAPFEERLESFRSKLSELNTETTQIGENLPTQLGAAAIEVESLWGSLVKSWDAASSKLQVGVTQVAEVFRQAFVNGVSNAFVAFGKALATGGNAMQDFGSSILSTLGSVAVQMGQFFLLVGAGMTASGPLLNLGSGPGTIAAGIGLMALGGVLQGMSGSQGGGVATTNANGTGGATSPSVPATEETQVNMPNVADMEERQRNKEVQVVIQGNVLNTRESALHIAELLNDAFDKEGVTIRGMA